MKDEFLKAVENFARIYAKMHDNLILYIETQGGKIDSDTGNITGLTDAKLMHVQIRNDQLTGLLEYHTITQLYIEKLESKVKRLDIENSLLQKGRSGESYSNDKVLKEIEFYMAYEITEETTQDDFTDVLRQIKYFMELALKRKILDPTPEHQNKLYWANEFLNDTPYMKKHLNSKKQKLGDLHPSVKNTFSNEQ